MLLIGFCDKFNIYDFNSFFINTFSLSVSLRGEEIGAYLKVYKDCDFVEYNL